MRVLLSGMGAVLWTVLGCTTLPKPALSKLPAVHEVKLEQLVLHSNFELPSHHRLLDELDSQRIDVSNKLALPVSDEPIHVFLFQTEELFHEFIRTHYPQFPSRRAFFVETDTVLTVYAHWGDRVAEDLRHEVSHGYLHSVVPKLPLWLDEGLAEYFEVPRGERGLNWPHVEELLALRAAGKWQPDLQRLENLTSPADMTQVDYAEAWAWVHLLLETHPARRHLLQAHVDTLRRTGTVEPLSLWVRNAQIEPQRSLIEHLEGLKSKAAKVN